MGLPVPERNSNLANIEKILYSRHCEIYKSSNAILIGKLSGGPQRYLHKLFMPSVGIDLKVEEILGFPAPSSYTQFLLFSDGATLFDNTLFLYGTIGASTRDISIENIRPLGLIDQNQTYWSSGQDRSTVEIGSIAAATKNYSIKLTKSGKISLTSPDGSGRYYSSFLPMLLTLVQIVNDHCGPNGLIDDSAKTLEFEIDSYIQTQQ